MSRLPKALLLTLCLTLFGCIDSGNRGWDLGPEPDPAGGALMEQAWRGVHGGRIGFRCRGGQTFLFIETWDPLDVPPGQQLPRDLIYQFEVKAGSRETVQGMATSRGIEILAKRVGEGAPNTLLRRLTDEADELLVTLKGATHLNTVLFDIEDIGHAHRHVQGSCTRSPAP